MERREVEPAERAAYRAKCKHRGLEDMCLYYTGNYGWAHVTYGCTVGAKCPRMKRWDKRQTDKQCGCVGNATDWTSNKIRTKDKERTQGR